jgi:hypothetical protein
MQCFCCDTAFSPVGDLVPHVLLCGHSVCFRDLTRLCIDKVFSCLVCQQNIEVNHYANEFPPKNLKLIEALESRTKFLKPAFEVCECGERAVQYCTDCKSDYCDTCCETAHKFRAFSTHSRVPTDLKHKFTTSVFCEKHNEHLKLFCLKNECRKPVCILCTTHGDHTGHASKLIGDVLFDEKNRLEAKVKSLEENIIKIKQLSKSLFISKDEVKLIKNSIMR